MAVLPSGAAQAAEPTGGEKLAWTYVSVKHPFTSYWNSSEDALVGIGANPHDIFRSFFRMDTSRVHGKKILSAYFQAYQNSGVCEPTVELWLTEDISPKTTWFNQPKWLTKIPATTTSDKYGVCFFSWRASDVVKEAAAHGVEHLTFGLRAAKEVGPPDLHILESDLINHPYFGRLRIPWLSIDYNSIPDVPSELGVARDYSWCESPLSSAVYVPTTTPALGAKLTDADSGQQVRARFQWADAAGAELGEALSYQSHPGYRHCVPIPEGQLSDGGQYKWRVRTEDQYQAQGEIELLSDASEWSEWQEFTVDTTRPAQPAVSSAAYPENAVGARVGTPGEFVFSPNGSDDVVAYDYRLSSDAPASGTVTVGADGTATVTITPTRYTPFPKTLTVSSIDRAGNRGPEKNYSFRVSRNPAPLVSSEVYPQQQYGGGVGVPGEFVFELNGAQDIVAYRYILNSGANVDVPVGEDGSARVSLTPDTPDSNVLTVLSVDRAGYTSAPRTYTFYVNPAP
ncbi:hypothetical protein [Nonomuraea sp. NPDC049784]|uniref:hypothetical protein n=1 Tax=Nonomuraea sp. NPDC049784 TaxID=3154361 RepID=UPI0033D42CD9